MGQCCLCWKSFGIPRRTSNLRRLPHEDKQSKIDSFSSTPPGGTVWHMTSDLRLHLCAVCSHLNRCRLLMQHQRCIDIWIWRQQIETQNDRATSCDGNVGHVRWRHDRGVALADVTLRDRPVEMGWVTATPRGMKCVLAFAAASWFPRSIIGLITVWLENKGTWKRKNQTENPLPYWMTCWPGQCIYHDCQSLE